MRRDALRGRLLGMELQVLIVDDNEEFLDAARALLEREGLSVVGVASTSADALRRAEQLQPNVMLVDIMLGDDSGFELARRPVADGGAGRPTVVLTSPHAPRAFADLIAECPPR